MISPCHTCDHHALRPDRGFAIWQCLKRKIVFGNDKDWKAGKNQPEKCGDYANEAI